MSERRSKLTVLVDVLRVVQRENSPVKPTHIMYKANLSHKLLKEHLNTLMQKGFLEQELEGDKVYYKITRKGQEFVQEFRKIEKLSEAFGLPI